MVMDFHFRKKSPFFIASTFVFESADQASNEDAFAKF
jgi:hypothetical protein